MSEESSSKAGKDHVEDLLECLILHEKEEVSFVWEEEIVEPPVVARCLVIARVHTTHGFSPSTLYSDMRST